MIIGVLASLVVLSLQSSVKKARDARAKDSLKQTQTAIIQVQAMSPDLTTLLGAGTDWTDVSDLLDKIVTIPGERLLSSVPLDGMGNSVQMKWNETEYVIQGSTTQGDGSCWYVSDKSSNISPQPQSGKRCGSIGLGT